MVLTLVLEGPPASAFGVVGFQAWTATASCLLVRRKQQNVDNRDNRAPWSSHAYSRSTGDHRDIAWAFL